MKKVILLGIFSLSLLLSTHCLQGQSLVWARDFQGTDGVEFADIEIGIDHKLYIIGRFFGTCDFDPGPATMNITSTGESDLFFAKYDTSGFPIWVKLVEGPTWESGYNIEVDRNLNVIIAGFYSVSPDFDPGPGVYTLPTDGIINGFVAKYNAIGGLLWANPINGLGWDVPTSLKVEADDHILLAGNFEDTIDFDPGVGVDLRTSNGMEDIFLVRYDRFGNFDWVYTTGGPYSDAVATVEINAKGQIVICGSFRDTVDFDPGPGSDERVADDSDMFWTVFDTSGTYLNKTTVLGGTGYDGGGKAHIDEDGNFTVMGGFEGTVDFDLGPGVSTLSAVGVFYDSFFARYDSAGALQYVHPISTSGMEGLGILEMDDDGNFILGGYFPYDLDVQPNADTVLLTSAGMRDIFLAKHEAASGELIWGGRIGGPKQDAPGNIAFDAYGNFYFCGFFLDSADFDLQATSTSYLVNPHSYDAGFLAKYTNDLLTAISPAEPVGGWTFYPNPALERVQLTSSDPMVAVRMLDLHGRQVAQFAPNGALKMELDLSGLPAGMYLLEVQTRDFTQTQKVLLR